MEADSDHESPEEMDSLDTEDSSLDANEDVPSGDPDDGILDAMPGLDDPPIGDIADALAQLGDPAPDVSLVDDVTDEIETTRGRGPSGS